MIRKSELLRQLAAIPGDPVVTVWQNATVGKVDGCDADIEEIWIANDNREGGEVVVLGIDVWSDGELVWESR